MLEVVGDPRSLVLTFEPRPDAQGEADVDQADARRLSEYDEVVLLCGRYEGVDERVLEARDVLEVSVGDYILSGGEPAALVLMDAIVRLLPGVMGYSVIYMGMMVALGLVDYRQSGLLKRIEATPVTPAIYLGSQIIAYMIIAVIQALIVLLVLALSLEWILRRRSGLM